MKAIITLLFFAAASVLTVRADHKRDAPWIVENHRGQNKCQENDPLGPCPSFVMTVENPLNYPVNIVFDCGYDVTQPQALISAKTRVTVEIDSDMPNGLGSCSIRSWSRKK